MGNRVLRSSTDTVIHEVIILLDNKLSPGCWKNIKRNSKIKVISGEVTQSLAAQRSARNDSDGKVQGSRVRALLKGKNEVIFELNHGIDFFREKNSNALPSMLPWIFGTRDLWSNNNSPNYWGNLASKVNSQMNELLPSCYKLVPFAYKMYLLTSC